MLCCKYRLPGPSRSVTSPLVNCCRSQPEGDTSSPTRLPSAASGLLSRSRDQDVV